MSPAIAFDDLNDYVCLSVFAYLDIVERVAYERVSPRWQDILRKSTQLLSAKSLPWLSDRSRNGFLNCDVFSLALRYPNLRQLSAFSRFPENLKLDDYAIKLADKCPKLEVINCDLPLIGPYCAALEKPAIKIVPCRQLTINFLMKDKYRRVEELQSPFSHGISQIDLETFAPQIKTVSTDYVSDASITRFVNLKELSLSDGRTKLMDMDKNIMTHLSKLPKLRILKLRNPGIELNRVCLLSNLKEFRLTGHSVGDEAMFKMIVEKIIRSNAKSLQTLEICCKEVNPTLFLEFYEILGGVCKSLTSLNIFAWFPTYLPSSSLNGIAAMKLLPQLRELEILWTVIDVDQLKELFSACLKLKRLRLLIDMSTKNQFRVEIINYSKSAPRRRIYARCQPSPDSIRKDRVASWDQIDNLTLRFC